MDKPIEFIQIDKETKKLKVSQDAIKELQKVNKPLKVVAIVGNSRSGKSFLMNRLMKRNNGFPLGSTINSETKGIWMWISDHPGDQDKALLLLDTEGLNDPIKGDQNHDAKIFTLATLLSSIIVLNSLSVIGAEQIEKFHLASQLSKHIQTKRSKTFPSSIKENKRDLEFATFFPELIWTQRDFYLELKDGKGQPITEDEYLEQCLMVKPDENETDSTSRAIKQAIRDHFPKRHCFTLPPPVTFNQLNHLDTLTESKLDHDFLEAGKKFTDFVYQCHSFYNLKGEMLTGQSFAILADQYTTLINDGSIDLQSAHSNMITSVNSGAIQTILSKFKDFLETLVFPMSNDAFFNAHTSQREILFKEFQIKCINLGDHMEFKEEFDNKFIDLIREYRIKNLSCSEAKCQEKLNELFQPVAANLKRNDYHKPGGYHNLRKDVDVMEVQYKDFDKPEETGPKYSEVKEEFWGKKILPLLSTIRQTDDQLSAAEKRIQKAEVLKEEATRKTERERMAREESEKLLEVLKQSQEKEVQEFKEKMKKSLDELTRQHQNAMDNAKREHDKLMEEGRVQEAKRRKEDATKYEEEIKVLEDNHQKAIKAIEDSKRRLIIVGSVAVLGLVVASAGMVALEVLAPEIALVVGVACKLVPAALNVAESVMTLMNTEGSENENEQQGESLESEGQAQI